MGVGAGGSFKVGDKLFGGSRVELRKDAEAFSCFILFERESKSLLRDLISEIALLFWSL